MAKKIYVVIVDDDLDNRFLTSVDFASIDWIEEIKIVEEADNLFDYLHTITPSDYPALIIVDYQLRKIDGEALYHLLKENFSYKNIQVAFYTSNLNQQVRSRLKHLGVQYFERPIDSLQGATLAQEIKAVAVKNALIDEN